MGAGIRIKNAAKIIVIDSNYSNLGLRFSGTCVTGGNSTGTGWYQASVSLPYSASQVCAFRADGYACFLLSRTLSSDGGTITYYFRANASGVTIQYRVYDDPAYLTFSGKVGIKINKPNGSRGFDSRGNYMRVIDFWSGVVPSTGTPSSNNTTYNGTVPFVAQGQLPFVDNFNVITGSTNDPPVIETLINHAVAFSGTNVVIQQYNTGAVNYDHLSSVPGGAVRQTAQYNFDYLYLDCQGT